MSDQSAPARWFIATGAFIYATGFLVEINYADFLGASGIANDLFKASYMLVGLLCLALPTIVIATAYAIAELKFVQREQLSAGRHGIWPTTSPMILLIYNFLTAFYLFVMFAPRDYIRNRPSLVWAIFAVTVMGNPLIRSFSRIVKEHLVVTFQNVAQWVLCGIIILVLDAVCFWAMLPRLWQILWPRGAYFLLFIAALTYSVVRMRARLLTYEDVRAERAMLVLGVASLTLIYLLAVYAFAYGVFPQIAASRGGGDYTESPHVMLTYAPDMASAVPSKLNRGGYSQPLILIQETSDTFVVADPSEAGGPSVWRNGEHKPTVCAVSRRAVVAVVSLTPQR